jgi:anti-sigma regulatory factor (Ser/Thr protein kinase)
MASYPHTAARPPWQAAGDPSSGTELRMASGGRPLALARANGAEWPWLEAAVQMAWRCCGCLPPVPASREDRAGGWATAPRVAMRTPPPATRSVATARAFTQRTLEKWGVVARSADAAAVVTELLTNALRHALPESIDDSATAPTWPIRLGLADPGPYVICAVADPSTDLPAPRHSDWQDEAGRGLLVVASLSDQWGYCAAPADQGKVVWAAFATASASR